MENKVFLDNLPKTKNGKVNWKLCTGLDVECIYDNYKYIVNINDYVPKTQKLKLEWNKRVLNIRTGDFSRCKLGNLFMKITSDFKIKIGTKFIDDRRSIVIINRERRESEKRKKWYKYKCLKCTFEGFVSEDSLISGCGCSCCAGVITVKGINDMATVRPDLVKYFKYKENAYLYTKQSGRTVEFKCPECGYEKKMYVCDLYNQGFYCNKCSDGISIPEKIIINILSQLKIDFKTQLNKSYFKWCDKYRYDFYIPSLNIIVETHGEQHYIPSTGMFKNFEQQVENDLIKKSIALNNGIKDENYIVIDCRYSYLDYIKSNILKSKLSEVIDMSTVDWDETSDFISSNLSIKVRDMWNSKNIRERSDLTNIAKELSISISTVRNYLIFWSRLDKCNYYIKKNKNI